MLRYEAHPHGCGNTATALPTHCYSEPTQGMYQMYNSTSFPLMVNSFYNLPYCLCHLLILYVTLHLATDDQVFLNHCTTPSLSLVGDSLHSMNEHFVRLLNASFQESDTAVPLG